MKQKTVSKISIPVKVFLTAAFFYAAAYLLIRFAALHFKIDPAIIRFFPLLSFIISFCGATYFYFDRPLAKLTETMTKAGEGDFLVRASEKGVGGISRLAQNFNRVLVKLTDLSARKIQGDHDLTFVQEELKYKKIIEKTNRSLENLVKDLGLLYEIGQRINQAIDMPELYEVIKSVLNKHLKLENFSLMVWDEKKMVLTIKAAFGFDEKEMIKEITFEGGEGIAGEVLKTGKAIYVRDVSTEPRFSKKRLDVEGSVLSSPLSYKGQTMGIVNFGRDKIDGFTSHDIKILTLVANQIALAMANAKLYTQTKELSVTDELTQVFNRRHFAQVMQLEWKRATRFKRDLSLLMIDVDFFKKYNDTHGHLKGDEVLRGMGRLLNANLREVDTVARFGGEEFVALLPDTDKRGAMAVAEKLRHLVQEQMDGITVSIGVANFPEDVAEMDELIDHADIALYDAKDQGRNRVFVYQSHGKPAPVAKTSEEKKDGPTKTRIVH